MSVVSHTHTYVCSVHISNISNISNTSNSSIEVISVVVRFLSTRTCLNRDIAASRYQFIRQVHCVSSIDYLPSHHHQYSVVAYVMAFEWEWLARLRRYSPTDTNTSPNLIIGCLMYMVYSALWEYILCARSGAGNNATKPHRE